MATTRPADEPVSVPQEDGPRARYRNQVRGEVMELAWEQITRAGASALSLKAIAKEMGMTAPALYRYFASRDDLLTELILSAYRDLAELVETAAAAGDDAQQRLLAVAQAYRRWATTHPQRYLMLYGTPVPGYAAPAAATALADRIFTPVRQAFSEDSGTTIIQSLTFWTRMHGVISLEVAGHFTGMAFDPVELFDREVGSTLTNLR